jgi:hypothetical protein
MFEPANHRFVALYQGATISGAHLIAASDDPELVRVVSARIDAPRRPNEGTSERAAARLSRPNGHRTGRG